MDELMLQSQPNKKDRIDSCNNNNDSVFESPAIAGMERNASTSQTSGQVVDKKLVIEMKNFAEGSVSTVGSDGRRLESEEFENISVSHLDKITLLATNKISAETPSEISDGLTVTADKSIDTSKDIISQNVALVEKEIENDAGLSASGVALHKPRTGSFDSMKFEVAHDVIEEEKDFVDGMDDNLTVNGKHLEGVRRRNVESGSKIDNDNLDAKETDIDIRSSSENDIWDARRRGYLKQSKKNQSLDEPSVSQGCYKDKDSSQFSGRVISIKEHYGHMMEMRRRSESGLSGNDEKPRQNYRKHSSGDLHSRLKTRKLLGVGETDDGDVHRSKLSQILGHSDQLYIRLPSGLRLWQIILAVVFSILSLWALMFPGHYFHAMYDMDGSSFTFPIRLYACALICISVMYWSTVQAADRHVIRMILLSSVVFFTLQSGVLMSLWLPWLPSTTPASLLCSVFIAFVARLIVIAVSSYFYWITYRDGKSKDVKYYR